MGGLGALAARLDKAMAAVQIVIVNEEIGGFGAQNERYIQVKTTPLKILNRLPKKLGASGASLRLLCGRFRCR